jgi:P27 family predicted phage terminase small subunit
MRGGPRPQPTALRVLHGNPSGRPLNAKEPKPVVPSSYDPPEHLTRGQRKIWREAIASAPLGLLRSLDLAVLELWCVHLELHRKAAAELFASETLVHERGAASMPDRRIGIMRNSAAVLARLSSELGFSPTSRSRVVAEDRADVSVATSGKKNKPPMTLEQYIASAPPRPSFQYRKASRRGNLSAATVPRPPAKIGGSQEAN